MKTCDGALTISIEIKQAVVLESIHLGDLLNLI